MSASVMLTVEAIQELLRQKDTAQLWINLPATNTVWQRVIRMTVDSYRVDTREDPELMIELLEDGNVKDVVSVRVSDVFELLPMVKAIIHDRADEIVKLHAARG